MRNRPWGAPRHTTGELATWRVPLWGLLVPGRPPSRPLPGASCGLNALRALIGGGRSVALPEESEGCRRVAIIKSFNHARAHRWATCSFRAREPRARGTNLTSFFGCRSLAFAFQGMGRRPLGPLQCELSEGMLKARCFADLTSRAGLFCTGFEQDAANIWTHSIMVAKFSF